MSRSRNSGKEGVPKDDDQQPSSSGLRRSSVLETEDSEDIGHIEEIDNSNIVDVRTLGDFKEIERFVDILMKNLERFNTMEMFCIINYLVKAYNVCLNEYGSSPKKMNKSLEQKKPQNLLLRRNVYHIWHIDEKEINNYIFKCVNILKKKIFRSINTEDNDSAITNIQNQLIHRDSLQEPYALSVSTLSNRQEYITTEEQLIRERRNETLQESSVSSSSKRKKNNTEVELRKEKRTQTLQESSVSSSSKRQKNNTEVELRKERSAQTLQESFVFSPSKRQKTNTEVEVRKERSAQTLQEFFVFSPSKRQKTNTEVEARKERITQTLQEFSVLSPSNRQKNNTEVELRKKRITQTLQESSVLLQSRRPQNNTNEQLREETKLQTLKGPSVSSLSKQQQIITEKELRLRCRRSKKTLHQMPTNLIINNKFEGDSKYDFFSWNKTLLAQKSNLKLSSMTTDTKKLFSSVSGSSLGIMARENLTGSNITQKQLTAPSLLPGSDANTDINFVTPTINTDNSSSKKTQIEMSFESRIYGKYTSVSTLPSIQEENFRRTLLKRSSHVLDTTSTPYRPTERTLIEHLSGDTSLNHIIEYEHDNIEKNNKDANAAAETNLSQPNVFNLESDPLKICNEKNTVMTVDVETINIASNITFQDHKNWYDVMRERAMDIKYTVDGVTKYRKKKKKKKQQQKMLCSTEEPQLEFGQLLARQHLSNGIDVNSQLANDVIFPNIEVEVSANNKHKSLQQSHLEKPNSSKNSIEDLDDCELNNIREIANRGQNKTTIDQINSIDDNNKSNENRSISVIDKIRNVHRTPIRTIISSHKETVDPHTEFLIANNDDICVLSDNIEMWRRMIIKNKQSIHSCLQPSYRYDPTIIISANKLYLHIKLIILKEIIMNRNVDLNKIKSIKTRLEASIAFSFLLELKSADVINLSTDGYIFSLK
ncbi:uncharacterized protein LOC119687579 isoform X1 [Teleopsis dalmanni]|uniref:uncharacterized protein LOC119687579 isoform X1 n=1 Tax=Teleopsis dalmanni TaxID=139649 RepID=UPI0018CF1936|nr:uncharacterized protein LOC119687579 isoform X1 [Teleopsis dalmanni]XP_037957872.1 uncharacterized protein LOC119687579 isoform X1 [Teleopsis dalmanni]XP_037957873.1 uncharacterized protein LOC119687579 isoform X1 [Teleopsis dalmanni]